MPTAAPDADRHPTDARPAPRGTLARLLLPEHPRDFRGRRLCKILLRAAHVLAAGTFAASHLLALAPERRGPWLGATLATGLAILLLDLFETAAFLLQVRGAVVLAKIAVLLVLPVLEPVAGVVLAALVVLSVVFSHAPSRVRYHLLLGGGRVAASRSRG